MNTLQPQQQLAGGRYTVQAPLTSGGMGALYLATDHGAFDRTVVIKTLLADDPTASEAEQRAAKERLLREARTLATLHYPTVPHIHACFEENGVACVAMEYIAGTDLSTGLSRRDASGARVAGRPYPMASVLRWGVSICRILEYLAACSPPVVHQDIKPANLILARGSGELYLVDFGAARTRAVKAPGGGKTAIFGTPGYAAPEQFQGQSEPRSDVYALAATLYHLATDDDPAEHLFDFPRLQHLGYLGTVLRDALQPHPDQRPTATELREQLETLRRPEGSRPLRAPDGSALFGQGELAIWCEGHWPRAADWLYGTLPDQVAAEWLQHDLAQSLRAWAAPHAGDHDAGLDAVLAMLDPHGFGQAGPALDSPQPQLDLGTFQANQPLPQPLVVRNVGRRHTRATVAPPPWLKATPIYLDLAPGQSAPLTLEPNWRARPGHRHDDDLLVRAGGQELLRVPVAGTPVITTSSGAGLAHRSRAALATTGIVATTVALMVVVMMVVVVLFA